jgi:6-phosphogluconolactonase
MRNLPATLGALAIVLVGCRSSGITTPAARNAPFVLIAPYVTVVGDIRSSNSVSVYKIDAATGALTLAAGSPFAAGKDPRDYALTPGGRFAYVVNEGSNKVSAYKINATTGALTPVAGSPFAIAVDDSSSGPIEIMVDPAGKYFYAVFDAGISASSINATTGALARVPGSPFDTNPPDSTGTASIAVDPSDRFAYVLNSFRHTVSAYTIDAAGALKLAGSPLDFGRNSNDTRDFNGVTVDPKGTFVYVTGPCCVYVYAIDATTGALAATAHISLGYHPSGEELTGFAIDPTGKFAYAVDRSRIYAYAISATTGTVRAIGGRKFAVSAGTDASGATIDPTGRFMYVYNGAYAISAYKIDQSTGELTQMSRSPFAVASNNTDPIARWFNAGRCAAFNGTLWTNVQRPPLTKRASESDIFETGATFKAGYFYDPKRHFALHVPYGDGVGTVVLKTSPPPPAGVARRDLSKLHTASGIKLGSSAAEVVSSLGQPTIVKGCALQRYAYLTSPPLETSLEFTIGSGRVIEISAELPG